MLLRDMTQTFGVSGREKPAVEMVRELLAPYADEVIIDALGSLIVVKHGHGANKKRLMAAAHIDQIGFCVIGIDDKGFIRVRGVGGISVPATHTCRVVFQNGVRGVICAEETDWAKNELHKLYIDIGAKSKEEAMSMVKLGDMISYEGELTELANGRYLSHGFDDRIGCYIMAETLMKQDKPYNDLYFSFSSQEEVGIRGTRSAAQRIKPDIGIAFDIGSSFDMPGCREAGLGNAVMGGGASIKMIDAAMISDEGLVAFLGEMCTEKSIAHQYEVAAGGGTDGAMIQAAGEGVRAVTISIPTRYGHTASEMIDIYDVNACIELLGGACTADFSKLFNA